MARLISQSLARAAVVIVASLSTAALASACEGDKKLGAPPAPSAAAPASPGSVAAMLGLDAGSIVETADPPPPAGDLKADLDHFVNIETCVKERANIDPLVGDALRAIGYDTFLRDACRLLEAAKDRKRETCDRIDSSALRLRCQTWVAMIAQTPDACPLQFEGITNRGRVVTCLAVAGKDPRLCAGEARTTPRATCDAMASRDEARCDVLLPSDMASCKREVARWRGLLATPLAGLPKLPAARGKLVVKGEAGTPDPATPTADLASEVARGTVVVTARERAHLEVGMLGESETSRMAPAPTRRPRLGMAVLLEPGATPKDPPRAVLDRLELEIPGEATLVHPAARCDCRITTARVDKTRGGEVVLALEGTIVSGPRSYKIEVELATFVRDVVPELPGGRVIPAAHPAISGTPRATAPSASLDAGGSERR